jgi:hypothetical protein
LLVVVGIALLAPPLILPQDPPPPVLGTGEHTYEWVRGWAKLPEGTRFGNTHGCIVVDGKNRVLVNTDRHGVMIFSAEGDFVKVWEDKAWRNGAHGMALAKEGDQEVLWIAHSTRHEVFKTTLDGEILSTLPFPEKCTAYAKREEYCPTSVAISPVNGDIYAADGYGKSWIHQYSAKGEYIRSWGGRGSEPGQLNVPHGLMIDTRGETPTLLVCDRENNRLQIFSLDGKSIGIVKENLRRPCHTHLRGTDIVVADLAGRITILDKENKLVAHLGENADQKKWAQNGVPRKDWIDGQFVSPHCAHWDSEGNLYVQDWLSTGRVTKLKRVK